MTKFQKRIAIIGLIITIIGSIIVPIYLSKKKPFKIPGGGMFEQKIILPEGTTGGYEISKTIKFIKGTNK